jgi:hypothetical protein
MTFRKLNLFPFSDVAGKTPTQLDPLDRADLNHRTKVQKPSNSDCDTPSSEPFRIYELISLWLFLFPIFLLAAQPK